MTEKINIKDHEVIIKYLNNNPIKDESSDIDGYRALFIIDNRYKIYFIISGTEYSSDFVDYGKSAAEYIAEKYGDTENCFKKIGIKYLQEKISNNNLKDEKFF